MRIPPVILFAAALAAQTRWGRRPSPGSALAAAPLVAAAGWLAYGSVREFTRHHTTVNPHDIARASSLVETGPNAVTRNPMYVALSAALVAHAIGRRSLGALLPAAAFTYAIDRWQIAAEEEVLARSFPEYADYAARVPRWL